MPHANRLTALTLLLLALALPSAAHAQDPLEGTWTGAIGPDSLALEIVVRFQRGPDGWSGTIDIPAQAITDHPLAIDSAAPEALAFTITAVPGNPTFEGALADDAITGTFRQAGQSFPFVLERSSEEDVAAQRRRPQEPTEPLPYDSVDVTYEGPAGAIAGTLTLPAGEGPFPAALLISGSGAQDRDSALAGHRPFLVLSDALTRAGFATLRADDRGVGGTEGSLAEADYDALVADALAGVTLLRERPEIDAGRVGVLGHSEGGYLAPLLADRTELAFTVLLAAPARPGLDVLVEQNRLLTSMAGATPEQVASQVAYIEALGEALRAGDYERARELTRAQVAAQYGELPEAQRPDPDEVRSLADGQAAATVSPYMRAFVTFDPEPYLRGLEVPTLALYGRRDVQVPPVHDAGKMRFYLDADARDDAEVRVLPGLNHLFQPAGSGNVEEYAQIETTFAPEALETVTDWLGARFVR